MSQLLDELMADINRARRESHILEFVIRTVRTVLLAGLVFGLWAEIRPEQQAVQLFLVVLTLLLGMSLGTSATRGSVKPDHVLFQMEIDYGTTQYPPFRLKEPAPPPEVLRAWQEPCAAVLTAFRAAERRRLVSTAATLPLPALLLILLVEFSPGALAVALSNVSRAVSRLGQGTTLTVLDGAPTDEAKKPIKLSGNTTAKIEVLAQNMIEIKVAGQVSSTLLHVDLRKRTPGKASEVESPVFQSFRLSPQRGQEGELPVWSIAFAATDDVELYLPFLSKSSPVAEIKVRQLPTPKVRLEAVQKLKDPWPDDQPLPLRIEVTAENPLQLVRLVIRTEQKSSVELVTTVMAQDRKELSTDYSLVLEAHVQSDIAEVEIVAEAVDRSLPTPLVGQSQPLVVRTASAFGRYRETLETLREIKAQVDEGVAKQDPKLAKDLEKLMEQAAEKAQDSPFFDSLDRLVMSRIDQALRDNMEKPDMASLIEASETLNDFLFEHEILDDKERDRDFFVAARSLSRLLEQEPKERSMEVGTVVKRMNQFLDDRNKRWGTRVARLPRDYSPKSWPRIERKPFHQAMTQIGELSQKNAAKASSDSLVLLSHSVSKYREWIEELEEREEAARSADESRRQQGLANARDQIRELQKRQGQISTNLDQAAARPDAELSQEWPVVRMNQNTNIKGTGSLEAQLRGLSPTGGERVRAALDAMREVVNTGNEKGYAKSESFSDLAGRLLRQADNATRKSQQRSQRGRRKRVAGDNYYGQQITGGDVEIKREYEVNRRYREDVLDEVGRYEGDSADQEEATVIENYLRRVIR